MAGRTHGMHAEPTTFGAKLALWCLQADRDRQRLRAGARTGWRWASCRARWAPTPTSTPRSRPTSAGPSGSTPVPATQVIARDRHAELLWACASVGATIEMIGDRDPPPGPDRGGRGRGGLRGRPEGQLGHAPQAQPDPVRAAHRSGPGAAGLSGAGLEDVALWHERDISHSSVERVILPDACLLTYYVLRRAAGLVDGLVVHADRMLANVLEGSFGLVFSQPVLLALVAVGHEPRRRLSCRPA